MSILFSPLDSIFGTTSKVRIIRLLCEQDRAVSARELSRLTGVARPAILNAIVDLEALGVLLKEESGGQFICRVNRQHILFQTALAPLIASEAAWTKAFFDVVRGSLVTPKPLAAWIFGSVAQGNDRPGSDIDLFVLAKTASDREKLERLLQEQLPGWKSRFGLSVSPFLMTLKRAVAQHRIGNPLLKNAVADVRVIVGQIPRSLLEAQVGNRYDAANKKQTRR